MTVNFGEETLVVGEKYDLEAVVTADGVEIEADVVFSIDGKEIEGAYAPAEAGEYTIVAVATVDGEEVKTVETKVVVEEAATEFVKATQKTLNTVVLTLNNEADAKKLVDNYTLLTAEYYVNDLTVPTPVKSVAAVKDDAKSVEVVLYNNIINDLKHTFIYGDAKISMMGTPTVPTRIEVVGATYEYQTLKDLVVKVYNAYNVDITAGIDLASRLTWSADTSENFYITTNQIYFYYENKIAKVKATLDMGLNENFEEITDLVAEGTYASVKTADALYAPHGYKLEGDNNFSNPIKMAVGDAAKKLVVAYKYKAGVNGPADYEIKNGRDNRTGDLVYTYYSSDKTVVMVDPADGTITPVAPGSTVVYIKSKNIYTNAESTIGTIAVSVVAKRKLDSVNVANAGDMRLSVNTNGSVNAVNLSYTAKDQLGAEYEGKTNFAYTITYPDALAGITGAAFENYFAVAPNAGSNTLALTQGPALQAYLAGVQATGKAYETIKIKVTVTDADAANNGNWAKSEYSVTVLARDVSGSNVQNRALGFSTGNVDMKLDKNSVGAYKATLALKQTDNQGFYLGDEPMTVIANKNAVTGNGYFVILKHNGNVINVDGTKITANGNVLDFNAVYGGGAGNEVKKMDKGTYTAELYKLGANNSSQYLGQQTLVLADSTVGVSVKINDDKVQVNPTLAQLTEAIKFYRGATEITNKVDGIVSIDSTMMTDNEHVFVRSVTVQLGTDEMQWADYGYTVVKFDVNKLFAIEQ